MNVPVIETPKLAAVTKKLSEEERKAKANAAAAKHREALKSKQRTALQQFVPTQRRDLLREFIKLANIMHDQGNEKFFDDLTAQLQSFVDSQKAAAAAPAPEGVQSTPVAE